MGKEKDIVVTEEVKIELMKKSPVILWNFFIEAENDGRGDEFLKNHHSFFDEHKVTPLTLAAYHRNLEIIRRLIDMGKHPNKLSENKKSPLEILFNTGLVVFWGRMVSLNNCTIFCSEGQPRLKLKEASPCMFVFSHEEGQYFLNVLFSTVSKRKKIENDAHLKVLRKVNFGNMDDFSVLEAFRLSAKKKPSFEVMLDLRKIIRDFFEPDKENECAKFLIRNGANVDEVFERSVRESDSCTLSLLIECGLNPSAEIKDKLFGSVFKDVFSGAREIVCKLLFEVISQIDKLKFLGYAAKEDSGKLSNFTLKELRKKTEDVALVEQSVEKELPNAFRFLMENLGLGEEERNRLAELGKDLQKQEEDRPPTPRYRF